MNTRVLLSNKRLKSIIINAEEKKEKAGDIGHPLRFCHNKKIKYGAREKSKYLRIQKIPLFHIGGHVSKYAASNGGY